MPKPKLRDKIMKMSMKKASMLTAADMERLQKAQDTQER